MGNIDFGTFVFIVATVVIFYQLRSVLGRRTGNERPPFDSTGGEPKKTRQSLKVSGQNCVPSNENSQAEHSSEIIDVYAAIDEISKDNSDLKKGLKKIKKSDPSFDPKDFMEGAKIAYEMILIAFAEANRQTLQHLLSSDVYHSFIKSINEREERSENVRFSFVGLDKAEFIAAGVKGDEAWIRLFFEAKSISVTFDSEKNIIAGDLQNLQELSDIWTFSRNTQSSDLNWKIIATEKGN